MPKTIQRVKFKKAIARHTKIRDQNLSLGYICPGEPHERSPNAPKFENRSREETEWQEQGAREAAWKLAKNVFKLKEHECERTQYKTYCRHNPQTVYAHHNTPTTTARVGALRPMPYCLGIGSTRVGPGRTPMVHPW